MRVSVRKIVLRKESAEKESAEFWVLRKIVLSAEC